MSRELKKVLYEYLTAIALAFVVILSSLAGFKFSYPFYYILLLTGSFILVFSFLLKRPQLIIFILTILIFIDVVIFIKYRSLLVNIVTYIDGFIKWADIYMNYTISPPGFDLLTEKYRFFMIIITVVIVTLIITLLNIIMRSWFLTLLSGILFFVVQWYNYVDVAYFYMIIYITICFIDIGIKNYFRKGSNKASIAVFLIIVTLLSFVTSFSAQLMPKNFKPVKWETLNNWFYDTFPFTRDWRNGEGTNVDWFGETVFTTFANELGGNVKPSNFLIMEVKADESTYLRGIVYDTYTYSSKSPLIYDNFSSRWENSRQQYMYVESSDKIPPTFSNNVNFEVKTITVIPLKIKSDILFSPWQPHKLSCDFYYEVDNLNLRAKNSHGTGEPYVVTYLKPEIDLTSIGQKGNETLKGEERERYLSYPATLLPERVKDLAYSLTKDKKTLYDKVKAVEEYLRQYPYSLDVPPTPPNRDFVDYFLFDLKKGYCSYFATSMVIMLRTVGIPARYVVGFRMPLLPSSDGRYRITTANAHAWVEVYFDDYGWVTFEPTPSYPSLEFPITGMANSQFSNQQDMEISLNDAEKKTHDSSDTLQQKDTIDTTASKTAYIEGRRYGILYFIIILIGAIVIAAFLYWWDKKKKVDNLDNRYLVMYYYEKILKYLAKRGLEKLDSETPLEYQKRMSSNGFEGFREVTQIYNETAYGARMPSQENIAYLKEFLKKLRKMPINKFEGGIK
ncbi:MAG TPA: transglutaminase domain-containing protein [Clostridia bacterium]|nr:transglutaminase domain-containing protein [Clostridia bacterium]